MLASLDCPASVFCCCCWYGSCLTLRLQKVTFTSKDIVAEDLRITFLLVLRHRPAALEVPNCSLSYCVVFWASFIQFAFRQ